MLASREQINAWLRDKKTRDKTIRFTAPNWEVFIRDRLRPALESGSITMPELVRFLGEIEEYGHQHVFLFRVPKKSVSEYLNPDHLAVAAKALQAEDVIEEPIAVDEPTRPVLADLRIDKTASGTPKALVAKVIETRWYRVLIDQSQSEGVVRAGTQYKRVVTKRYGEVSVRAVNVVQLNSSGLVEVRIRTHETALDYQRECSSLLLRLKDLLPPRAYSQYPISNAKANLWDRKDQLRDRIEPGTSFLRNPKGTVMTMSPGEEQGNLLGDKGALGSIDLFVRERGSFDKADYRVRRADTDAPGGATQTHVLLGEMNECVILGQCSRQDHENVLDLIVNNN